MGEKRGKITLSAVILSVILVSFFSLYFVFAAETGNYKEFDKTGLEYGKISIIDSQDTKLAEYTLTKNTDQCLVNCYAEGTTTLYSNGYLFTDLKFKDTSNSLTNINSNKILIETTESYQVDVNDYKEVCEDKDVNGTIKNICYQNLTGSHKETRYRNVWNEYNNEILTPGTYKWRIEGKKSPKENIDWIGSSFGVDFEEWAWWNGSWERKIKINITENAGENLTDYSVLVKIPKSSYMNNNCSDLRFVNGSENSELDYYLTVCNSTDVYAYVKLPSLSSSSTITIYSYYNNSGASSTSTKDAFYFYDEFSGASLNTSKWNTFVLQNEAPSVSGGYLRIVSDALSGTNYAHAQSKAELTNLKVDFFNIYTQDNTWYGGIGLRNVVAGDGVPLIRYETRASDVGWDSKYDSTEVDANSIIATSKSNISIQVDQDKNMTWTNYNSKVIFGSAIYGSSLNWNITFSGLDTEGNGKKYSYYDEVRMRKYVNPEPTYSIGAENINTNWTVTFNLTDSITGEQIDTSAGNVDFDISCDNGFSVIDVENDPYTTDGDIFPSGTSECIFSGLTNLYYDKNQTITANSNNTLVEVPMSKIGGLSQEQHDWLEAIHNCIINGVGCA